MATRYYVRLTFAYLSRFKGTILVGILLGIIIFFIIRVTFPLFLSGNTEKIGLTGRYRTNELPDEIVDLVSDGLTIVNNQGYVEPGLASSWETPDKGKTWIFRLNNNISWQDGTSVTSESISYEFSDVTLDKPDTKTIIFKLEDPFSPFPVVVSKPTFSKGLLGTGEWKVDDIIVLDGFVHELVLTDKDKNKKIYKFYPTVESTKLAYKLGEVDTISSVLDVKPFDTWKNTHVVREPNVNQVVVLFFNTQDSLLSEKSLRQALIYAIDKDQMGERAISPISPNSWAFNPQVKPYSYDVGRAKELIDEIPDEAKSGSEINIVTGPYLLPTAESIAKSWEVVGFKSNVHVSSEIPTEFQAFLTILDIPKDPDQYPLWHTTQTATNISKYTSPRTDKLLEDGRSELNTEERRRIYLDFQRFLLEDAPAAFLYHPTYYTISRK